MLHTPTLTFYRAIIDRRSEVLYSISTKGGSQDCPFVDGHRNIIVCLFFVPSEQTAREQTRH